jgi:hypothetical protein
MRHLNRQLAYSDATIERVAAHDERVQRLRAVPSVGPVTAAAFVATIDDVQRFSHAHQLEAYLGLVPRENSSGDTQRRGCITKAGSSRTRWLLIQAAVSILGRRPPEADALRAWALRIVARCGKHLPSSRWPGAWPAPCMRSCATAPSSRPARLHRRGPPTPRRPAPRVLRGRSGRQVIGALPGARISGKGGARVFGTRNFCMSSPLPMRGRGRKAVSLSHP